MHFKIQPHLNDIIIGRIYAYDEPDLNKNIDKIIFVLWEFELNRITS